MTNKTKLENILVRVTPLNLIRVLTSVIGVKDHVYVNSDHTPAHWEEFRKAQNERSLTMDPILEFDSFICELKDLKKVTDIIDNYEDKIKNSRKLEDLEEMKTILKNLGIKFSFNPRALFDDKEENVKIRVSNNYFIDTGWRINLIGMGGYYKNLSFDELLLELDNEE